MSAPLWIPRVFPTGPCVLPSQLTPGQGLQPGRGSDAQLQAPRAGLSQDRSTGDVRRKRTRNGSPHLPCHAVALTKRKKTATEIRDSRPSGETPQERDSTESRWGQHPPGGGRCGRLPRACSPVMRPSRAGRQRPHRGPALDGWQGFPSSLPICEFACLVRRSQSRLLTCGW